jgi:valyl-tRNA synthetase
MELSKNFEPNSIETKWYSHWQQKGYFASKPNQKEAYTIVMPPPNVTGVLHMGHCLNNTIQDILIRHARMNGKNACWVPGTDHASIATEAKVVALLREQNIAKSSLSRDKFLEHAWEWKNKYGGIILEQLKKMGCSLDWNRTTFTMDDDYYKSVIGVFVDLHKQGVIYRGLRMVNWDPQSKTALSDEEVIFKDVDSQLYYVTYKMVDDANTSITVATTRPETILGDVAICVNPTDERYKNIIGKQVYVPLIKRKIPIIADEYVDATFGTGALKITPAHDKNDNEIGKKHNLACYDTLTEEGKFTAEQIMHDSPSELILGYNGMDRFALRKQIVKDIDAAGCLQKTEPYKGQVGTSERTGAVIESRLSMQWFMNMKMFLEKNPETISAVMNDEINFYPVKFKNLYNHWMTNIKDWCISRQLWWGQRIPAWYDAQGNIYVGNTLEEVATKNNIDASTLQQDEDCLDTWFSSWLWPFEVFKGYSNKNNEEVNYYYPTTTLVTAPEIIFFWVARMIMAGQEFTGKIPFKHVYFTGIVRDKQGRKMSKSLGNSPDLLALIDQYGADAVRFGIMIASPAGNDILFDESSLEQGRNFNNKMWNALKLIKMWQPKVSDTLALADTDAFALNWFEQKLNETTLQVHELIEQFKLSEALKVLYSTIWNDFCSWYLEWIKPGFDQPIPKQVYEATVNYFSSLLQLLHPFMPFVTEEIYHTLAERNTDLCVLQFAAKTSTDKTIIETGKLLQDSISGLRDVRNKNVIKPKDEISIAIDTQNNQVFESITGLLQKQVNASTITFTSIQPANTVATVIGTHKFYVGAAQLENVTVNKDELEKELAHLTGFLLSIEKKLSNEKFTANAKPEVLAMEKKKKDDTILKMNAINDSLSQL